MGTITEPQRWARSARREPNTKPWETLNAQEEGEDQRPRQEMQQERVSGRRQCQADKRQKTSSQGVSTM